MRKGFIERSFPSYMLRIRVSHCRNNLTDTKPSPFRISVPIAPKHHSCPNTVTELSPCCQHSLIAFSLLSSPDNLGSATPRHSHQADGKSGHAWFFTFFLLHQVDPFCHSFHVAALYVSLDFFQYYNKMYIPSTAINYPVFITPS